MHSKSYGAVDLPGVENYYYRRKEHVVIAIHTLSYLLELGEFSPGI
jgi:hypothetical protein